MIIFIYLSKKKISTENYFPIALFRKVGISEAHAYLRNGQNGHRSTRADQLMLIADSDIQAAKSACIFVPSP